MGYCYTLTQAGFALQAKLFAEGGNLNITRVAVGSGVLPEGADPTLVSALFQERGAATSTTPIRRACAVDFEIEYRADLNPEITDAFQISEFGVFGLGAEGRNELLIYGDLSSYPETAVPQAYGGCVRRYPVHVEIGPKAGATLNYPAGAWATYHDMASLAQELAIRRLDLTIPAAGWMKEAHGGYQYRLDVPVEYVTPEMIPQLTISAAWEEAAIACGLCPQIETVEGAVRLRAVTAPEVDIPASLVLMRDSTGVVLAAPGPGGGSYTMPVATAETPGAVKPGAGLVVDQDGTISVDTATDEEVQALLEKEG